MTGQALKIYPAEKSGSAPCNGSARSHILYQSSTMQRTVADAQQFAASSATILLTGESGTGKELFARLIHESSERSDAVFARVNCAALSENLIESELFGHEQGSFTGASTNRVGRFEWANHGTLLLDEVSEIPPAIQAKLLRVLEENEFQRVGSNKTISANVRVIATSNRDLEHEVQQGNFRLDLYHRLNVLQLDIPPLRQRIEDIPLLVNNFINRFASESSAGVRSANEQAMRCLVDFDWPGNIRQLRNTIHRACVLAKSETFGSEDLTHLQPEKVVSDNGQLPHWMTELKLDEVERMLIIECLEAVNWNKTVAASKLGVTARTLSNKLRAYREKGLLSFAS